MVIFKLISSLIPLLPLSKQFGNQNHFHSFQGVPSVVKFEAKLYFSVMHSVQVLLRYRFAKWFIRSWARCVQQVKAPEKPVVTLLFFRCLKR